MASPDFIARHSLDEPSKLARAPLIEQRDTPWDVWFDHTGLEAPVSSGRPTFDDEQLALDAAAAGLGAALTYAEVAAPYLESGQLVRAPGATALGSRRAWLVWREDNPKLRLIRNFSWWLRGELGLLGGDRSESAA